MGKGLRGDWVRSLFTPFDARADLILYPCRSPHGGRLKIKRDTVIFVSRPTTPFFMQEYWGGVGKRPLTAQNHPCYWLRSV